LLKKSHKKILIIDDEPIVCEYLSETLKGAGYETLIAGGGYEGLQKARSAKPDLILLDVMMPILSGWQMLEKMRRDPEIQNIPVVLLTAKSETDSMFKSQQYKVLDYFIKPIEPLELITFVDRYVQR
jgi:CheY-like chemotaxis protein